MRRSNDARGKMPDDTWIGGAPGGDEKTKASAGIIRLRL
jgi:hypothetical protein